MIDGSTVDLQGGINQLKRAIEATSDNAHPDQGKYLDSYGKMLLEMYSRTKDKEYLRQAFDKIEQAVGVTSGHPNQGYYFNSLSIALSRKYEAYNDKEFPSTSNVPRRKGTRRYGR